MKWNHCIMTGSMASIRSGIVSTNYFHLTFPFCIFTVREKMNFFYKKFDRSEHWKRKLMKNCKRKKLKIVIVSKKKFTSREKKPEKSEIVSKKTLFPITFHFVFSQYWEICNEKELRKICKKKDFRSDRVHQNL